MNLASTLAATLLAPQTLRNLETLPIGLGSVDRYIESFPRGSISEVVGPESSGRATMVHSLLASSTSRLEICAYVDASDAFDPHSAAASGVVLSQLLWIRCGHDIERAFKAADLLIHAGGFGVVALDLTRVPDRSLRRIPISYWYRFRRAVENTATVLALLEREAQAKSCAAMILNLTRKQAVWSGAPGFHLLQSMQFEVGCRKPVRSVNTQFEAKVMG